MNVEPENTDVSLLPKPIFGIVPAGKPLSRAVWTENRELAEDMLSQASDDAPMELWEANLRTRST